jgi:hypothetical protein
MKRNLGWLALVVALAVPAAMAWAEDGKADAAGKAGGSKTSCCCCCDKACPR